jgi:hypothetical protein
MVNLVRVWGFGLGREMTVSRHRVNRSPILILLLTHPAATSLGPPQRPGRAISL